MIRAFLAAVRFPHLQLHHHTGAVVKALTFALIASFAYGIGAVCQGLGAKTTEKDTSGVRGFLSILKHPLTLAGLLLDIIAWVLSRLSLHKLPLFTVQTVLAGSLAITVGLSQRVMHTPKRRSDVYAILATAFGLVLVGIAADPHRADPPTHAFKIVLWIALPLLCAGGISLRQKVPPPVLGALGGTAFGFSALAARAIPKVDGFLGLLQTPLLWLMLAYAAGGVVFFTRGVERGQVGAVTAAMWAAEIIPSSALGFLMLGDSVRPGWGAAAALGMIATLGATYALARPVEIPNSTPGDFNAP